MSTREVVESKPRLTVEECRHIAREIYGLDAEEIKQIPSYDDQNFRISYRRELSGGALELATMKISNPTIADLQILDFQNQACNFLSSKGVPVPTVLPIRKEKTASRTESGNETDALIASYAAENGKSYPVRLLRYLQGKVLAEAVYTEELMMDLGQTVGKLSSALQEFNHPIMKSHDHGWNLRNMLNARGYLEEVPLPAHRKLAAHYLQKFESEVQPKLKLLREGLTHHDCNEYNILVDAEGRTITGIIDFGDMVYSTLVLELCITIAYAILRQEHIEPIIKAVVRGYHSVMPLQEEELNVLYYGVCARLTQSVLNSTHQLILEPENTYVAISQAPAWEALKKLHQLGPETALQLFKEAVGQAAT